MFLPVESKRATSKRALDKSQLSLLKHHRSLLKPLIFQEPCSQLYVDNAITSLLKVPRRYVHFLEACHAIRLPKRTDYGTVSAASKRRTTQDFSGLVPQYSTNCESYCEHSGYHLVTLILDLLEKPEQKKNIFPRGSLVFLEVP